MFEMCVTRLGPDFIGPGFVDHFGWCTWDSFYTDLSPQRVLGGLDSFNGRHGSSSSVYVYGNICCINPSLFHCID